jgi:hypothetical protein
MMEIINSNISLCELILRLWTWGLASILVGFNDDDGFYGRDIEWVYLSKRSCWDELG